MSQPPDAQQPAPAGKMPPTKAERRALQEAQRAAKQKKKEEEQAQKQAPTGDKPAVPRPESAGGKRKDTPPPAQPPQGNQGKDKQKDKQPAPKERPPAKPPAEPQKKKPKAKAAAAVDTADIHPSVLRLGLQYQNYSILGGNARCVALLVAMKDTIESYKIPENRALDRDLIPFLNRHIQYLINCRKLSISMGNAISFIKHKVQQLFEAGPLTEQEVKASLKKSIDLFLYERIQYADKKIAANGAAKIVDSDVVLTYGRSTAVELIIKEAVRKKKRFSVVVVDSRPLFEGRELVRRLCAIGVKCTYVLISALSSVMREVTKVLVGAAAVLTNGGLWNRIGTASVCMMAQHYHKPVLCCCETYKFTDKTWLNSFSNNEEGDFELLLAKVGRRYQCVLEPDDQRDRTVLPSYGVQNLLYDLTPPQCIAMLITEVGVVPPTSVQVIIREYHLTVSQ